MPFFFQVLSSDKEVESALGRHLRELRANVGTDALFVTIIEQNYGGWV